MTVSQRLPDRVWTELNARPLKPCRWGVAVDGRAERIETPALIGEPTMRFTTRALRQSPCPVCGNRSRAHCACEIDVQREHRSGLDPAADALNMGDDL